MPVAACAGMTAFADPASAPIAKPAMRSMSPKTAPDVAVLPPPSADSVWVNTATRTYHCPGNRWYGRTPTGVYMSEAEAKTKGYRADGPKGCS